MRKAIQCSAYYRRKGTSDVFVKTIIVNHQEGLVVYRIKGHEQTSTFKTFLSNYSLTQF